MAIDTGGYNLIIYFISLMYNKIYLYNPWRLYACAFAKIGSLLALKAKQFAAGFKFYVKQGKDHGPDGTRTTFQVAQAWEKH